MWETFSRQARVAAESMMRSVEERPWLWVALLVVTLVILIRRQKPGSLQ
jgi:hypothetical protein